MVWSLDQLLELSMEVLDDFTAEAEEVHEFNPWLNYALPLHRMREMGYQDRIFVSGLYLAVASLDLMRCMEQEMLSSYRPATFVPMCIYLLS